MDSMIGFAGPVELAAQDLSEPERVRREVLAHGLVVVRGWTGSEEGFVDLGRRLGRLERASPREQQHGGQLFRVTSSQPHATAVGRYWHADGFAHSSAPAMLTIYHVASGTACCSGTAFTDGAVAWRNLDAHQQTSLRNRTWTHASGARHAFCVLHHATGTEVLSVNLGKTIEIQGLSRDEMQTELDRLHQTLSRGDVYTHHWRPGDLLLADNRRLLHHAPQKIWGKRELWRVSVVEFM